MRYLEVSAGTAHTLKSYGSLPPSCHVFDLDSIEAVNAALATGRPLLVRGEPGTGKSQLARAAAAKLERAYLPFTVDARAEARDLLYTVDTVARLAEAQIAGHLPAKEQAEIRSRLAEVNFTSPGPLWWAFDWESARQQSELVAALPPFAPAGWQAAQGAVLLIDEIDKGDAAVPNGLLEALGQGRFQAPGGVTVAAQPGGEPPLVIITTNEERALPDAFVRRCLVLQLGWPEDEEKLISALMERGKAHFKSLEATVLREAAEMLAEDRAEIRSRGVCPPGGAEYLDLLRAVAGRWAKDESGQLAALKRIRSFALRKHPEESAW